jgi:hypothetical protein
MVDVRHNNGLALNAILRTAIAARRAEISAEIARVTGNVVQSGPFQGMILPDTVSWGDGDLAPKALGCYEAELHPAIERTIAADPLVVINIGCAEGYYAIGLARRLPGARVHAFDIAEKAQEVCVATARRNGVDAQVTVGGMCTADMLAELADGAPSLVVMDCEGGELDLVTARSLPALAHSTLLIECHDFIGKPILPTLTERLAESHAVEVVREGARDPNAYPILRGLGSHDRWLSVCEFRPVTMSWLIATPLVRR